MNISDHGPVTISVGASEINYEDSQDENLFSVDEIPHRCRADVVPAKDGNGTKLLLSTRMKKIGTLGQLCVPSPRATKIIIAM